MFATILPNHWSGLGNDAGMTTGNGSTVVALAGGKLSASSFVWKLLIAASTVQEKKVIIKLINKNELIDVGVEESVYTYPVWISP